MPRLLTIGFIIISLCFFSCTIFAFNTTYTVKGVMGDLGAVEGVAVENTVNDETITGQLTDENGNVHSFEGTWTGDGEISGETDDGYQVELNTVNN